MLGISVDSQYSHNAFAEKHKFSLRLLSDFPKNEVSKAYGVFLSDKGHALRGTFLVDRKGVVRYTLINELGKQRDFSEALEKARGLR